MFLYFTALIRAPGIFLTDISCLKNPKMHLFYDRRSNTTQVLNVMVMDSLSRRPMALNFQPCVSVTHHSWFLV